MHVCISTHTLCTHTLKSQAQKDEDNSRGINLVVQVVFIFLLCFCGFIRCFLLCIREEYCWPRTVLQRESLIYIGEYRHSRYWCGCVCVWWLMLRSVGKRVDWEPLECNDTETHTHTHTHTHAGAYTCVVVDISPASLQLYHCPPPLHLWSWSSLGLLLKKPWGPM
jgi:hypothetical protein